jgi:hypothetical protein
MTSASPSAHPTYRVRAQSVESRNCALGSNCNFGWTPNEGFCEFIIGYGACTGLFVE